jgi:hypothetical protein
VRPDRIAHQGVENGGGVGQSGSFDDHALKLGNFALDPALPEIAHGHHQIAAHRTAKTAGIEHYCRGVDLPDQ